MSASDLAERYGRTKRDTRRTRFWAYATAGIIILVFGAWAIWAGLFTPTASVETNTIGTVRIADNAIRVSWELSVDPGRTAQCAVEALNEQFGVVGWKIVDVAAADTRTRTLHEDLLTSEPSTSGLIYRCWLS